MSQIMFLDLTWLWCSESRNQFVPGVINILFKRNSSKKISKNELHFNTSLYVYEIFITGFPFLIYTVFVGELAQ